MEYIYTGKLNYTNDEELEPLCEAASLLMMPELKDKLATARTNAQLVFFSWFSQNITS